MARGAEPVSAERAGRRRQGRARERARRFMNVRDIIKTHALIEKVSVRKGAGCAASCTKAIPTARLNIFAYIMTPLKAEAGGWALARSHSLCISLSRGKSFNSRPNGVGGRLVTWTQHEY